MIALIFAVFFASGCSTMKQSQMPSVDAGTENMLSSTVKLRPINAKTLVSIESERKKRLASAGQRRSLPKTAAAWDYKIGPGDVLSIVVWDHPQLTIPAGPQRTPQEAGNWVGPNGNIFYPYIGQLRVAGKTIGDVREDVARGLSKVIPNPQVDVSIARFGSQRIQVTGAVTSPGSVPVTNIPLNMLEAIEFREGVLPDGDLERIKVLRGGREFTINLKKFLDTGSVIENPRLQGDDIVVIPRLENNEVYVLGEVNSPGIVPMTLTPLSLTAALAGSDGISKASANASGIFVFRTVSNQKIDVYQLDITDPTALLLGTRFELVRGDVVYATSAPATRWNRVISNIIPTLGALNTLLLIDDRS